MDLWSEPPLLPSLTLPEAPVMPEAVLEVPRAQLPSYKPLVVPPSVLKPPPGIEGSEPSEEQTTESTKAKPKPTQQIPLPPEVQLLEIPFTEVEVPMPSTQIMTTAATTAFISVAATLTATSLFKYIVMVLKPVFKQTWSKLTKKKEQKAS